MALINCAECGGRISTKAAICPHCGCPVESKEEQSTICIIHDVAYDVTEAFDLATTNDGINHTEEGLTVLRRIIGPEPEIVNYLWYYMTKKGKCPHDFMSPKENAKRLAETKSQSTNLPKCPTCGSTNIEKITAFDRGVAAGVFGMISKTARSQFRCRGCGYLW